MKALDSEYYILNVLNKSTKVILARWYVSNIGKYSSWNKNKSNQKQQSWSSLYYVSVFTGTSGYNQPACLPAFLDSD